MSATGYICFWSISVSAVTAIYLLKAQNNLGVAMSAKRLSNEEFQTFLHALFDNDRLKVKYQNPDAWRGYLIIKWKLQPNSNETQDFKNRVWSPLVPSYCPVDAMKLSSLSKVFSRVSMGGKNTPLKCPEPYADPKPEPWTKTMPVCSNRSRTKAMSSLHFDPIPSTLGKK